jgi:hypothetical protein
VAAGSAGSSILPPAGINTGALTLHVEDIRGLTIEIVTLSCAGECADIEAVARGGNPPYMFAWEDGSTSSQRHVCLTASKVLSVSAVDTAIRVAEFGHDAQTATARVNANVLTCNKSGAPCDKRAPDAGAANSFDPVVKWSWPGGGTLSTPLVANLTDDNADGIVDINDTPDVVVTEVSGTLVVLDGRTGQEEVSITGQYFGVVPALGDIDGDKRPDIVSVQSNGPELAVFHADGKPIWSVPLHLAAGFGIAQPIALADLDHDGSPEIIVGENVFDAKGQLLWNLPASDVHVHRSPTAADLDDDGYLEVTWGDVAYRHDGTLYYRNAEATAAADGHIYAALWSAIADLDADQIPEIVLGTGAKLLVLDHTGKTLRSVPNTTYGFPPAIHDLDGDGMPEILISDGSHFTAYTGDLKTLWSMPVSDQSGWAASTAFDFLGDGSAEAMYGDETNNWGFDGRDGHVIFKQPRISATAMEYPAVADVDNDGSADILMTSQLSPTLQVISDRMNRWIPARHIMNQDTYHVTNVNEDGSIPVHELSAWKSNNSFRAQAQINPDGSVCLPKR